MERVFWVGRENQGIAEEVVFAEEGEGWGWEDVIQDGDTGKC